jgi:hypothetical protein
MFCSGDMCIPYNNLYLKEDKINKIQTGGHYKQIKGGSNECQIIKIGTFIYALNHLLIHRQYQYINRSDDYKLYEHMMKNMLDKRHDYLEKNVMTVVDNSPYREFIMRCVGDSIDSIRAYRIKMSKKRAEKKATSFRYDPATQRDGFKMPEFTFKNSSGNEYKNGIMKMFNINHDNEESE